MKYLFLPLLFIILILLNTILTKTASSDYDYILGQEITLDDIEPPDNYDLQVFMEEDEAIESIFKECDEVFVDKLILSPKEKKLLEDRLRRELDNNSFNVFIGKKQQKTEKYAIITDERGCFHPITFITSVKQNGKIDKVAIMIYRESRGKEVTRTRFLHQYNGKSVESPIRLNKDIIHITGATTSVRGINRGVRKTLAILDEFYFHGNRNVVQTPYNNPKNLPENLSNDDAQIIFSHAFYALGDIIEILIAGTTEAIASKAFKEVSKETKRLDNIFNKAHRKSELYRVNQKAGKKSVKCSSDLINVIRASIRYSKMTNGDFDITEGSLSDKLQKASKKKLKPKYLESLIDAASYKNIIFDNSDDNGGKILLKEKLTKINSLLVSKGYVVDKIIESLKKSGISDVFVNFGGNIRVIGNPPGDTSWKIAIPDPRRNDKSLGYIKISDKAVAISGDYEKTLIKSRKELSDVYKINLQKPFETNLINTIIIAPTAFEADSISALAILSKMNQDMKLINEMSGIEWMNLYNETYDYIETKLSSGMKNYFVQTVENVSAQRTKPACAF